MYESEGAPRELLRDLEGFIDCAHEMGIVKLMFAKWAERAARTRTAASSMRRDLSPDDAQRLRLMIHEINHVNARHIALGSPSGCQ